MIRLIAALVAFVLLGVPSSQADLIFEDPDEKEASEESAEGEKEDPNKDDTSERKAGADDQNAVKTGSEEASSDATSPEEEESGSEGNGGSSSPDGEASADENSSPGPESAQEEDVTSGVLAPKPAKEGHEQSDESELPVHWESNSLKGLRDEGTVELIDDVIVTQGTLRVESNYAKVYFDKKADDVDRVIGEGDVRIFKTDEKSGERIKAFADTVTFDNKARTIKLEGNARLWRGKDLVKGRTIIYELDSGWIRADRVAGEVHPDQDRSQ